MSFNICAQTRSQTLRKVHQYITSCQRDDGAILWFNGGKLDPWDHTEAAMALSIVGDHANFKKAFDWLVEHQNQDGSWFAKYYGETNAGDNNGGDFDRFKIETNFVAYPACGLWHYFLISQDKSYIEQVFPCIERAINFIVSQQSPEGDIQWAISAKEKLPKDALITACSSILRSLECAIHLANTLGVKHHWHQSYNRLANALLNKPWRFDRTWEPKTRFSMDWFYPILSGIYKPTESQIRLESRWNEFIHPDFGCRCVNDEPWMTIAESCECVLALIASEQKEKALKIFEQLLRWQDEDGGFWTGYSFRDKVIWPKEKTTWTAAAILLALDALEGITPAANLFTTPSEFLFT